MQTQKDGSFEPSFFYVEFMIQIEKDCRSVLRSPFSILEGNMKN